jgi:hypothetical protein
MWAGKPLISVMTLLELCALMLATYACAGLA